mmetsp:Transcript_11698/g.38490  ORF Transcript_11698/g.38490 Transcript_11698/m.38490 type:complete len:265 (+) Transcript_11698:1108-1902(+)
MHPLALGGLLLATALPARVRPRVVVAVRLVGEVAGGAGERVLVRVEKQAFRQAQSLLEQREHALSEQPQNAQCRIEQRQQRGGKAPLRCCSAGACSAGACSAVLGHLVAPDRLGARVGAVRLRAPAVPPLVYKARVLPLTRCRRKCKEVRRGRGRRLDCCSLVGRELDEDVVGALYRRQHSLRDALLARGTAGGSRLGILEREAVIGPIVGAELRTLEPLRDGGRGELAVPPRAQLERARSGRRGGVEGGRDPKLLPLLEQVLC